MGKKLTIVKVGGAVVEDKDRLNRLLDAFCTIPGPKIMVTGGGRTASSVAAELGLESHMHNGRRITDEPMLRVVTMVYAGLVSKNIVARMQARGENAIGLCGADLDIVRCEKRAVGETDYGFVGDVSSVNVGELRMLIDNGAVPVICPITHDGKGQLLNTNADTIASALSSALAKEYDVTLIFCFEKKGVLYDAEKEDSVIPEMRREDYERLKEEGIVDGGMIPKLDNAFSAVESGVDMVIITNEADLGKDSGTRII